MIGVTCIFGLVWFADLFNFSVPARPMSMYSLTLALLPSPLYLIPLLSEQETPADSFEVTDY